jgi:predicted RNA binding protein YcfA (HicA-like mRNA interferase family)
MPKGYFNWSFNDVVKFLKDYGFGLNHTRGSHYYYVGMVNGKLQQVCVAFHGNKVIKPRTLKSIILQSGISKKEWLQ